MVRALRSYSTSGGSVRSHPKERALKEGHEIRLRSGSAGHRYGNTGCRVFKREI